MVYAEIFAGNRKHSDCESIYQCRVPFLIINLLIPSDGISFVSINNLTFF